MPYLPHTYYLPMYYNNKAVITAVIKVAEVIASPLAESGTFCSDFN